jgi:hypothetical protein
MDRAAGSSDEPVTLSISDFSFRPDQLEDACDPPLLYF